MERSYDWYTKPLEEQLGDVENELRDERARRVRLEVLLIEAYDVLWTGYTVARSEHVCREIRVLLGNRAIKRGLTKAKPA